MITEILTAGIIGIFGFYFYTFCAPKLIKWRSLREEMITTSIQYANYFVVYVEKNGKEKLNDKKGHDDLYALLRRIAGEVSSLSDVHFYKAWVHLGLLPTTEKIELTRRALIGWGNSLVEKGDGKLHREIFIEQLKKATDQPNSYKELREIQKIENKNARRY